MRHLRPRVGGDHGDPGAPEALGERPQTGEIAPGHHPDHLEPIREARDHVDRLAADRAGGPEEDDAPRGRRGGWGVHGAEAVLRGVVK